MDKPAHMFDRDSEWASLARFVGNPAQGATIGVIYGRRRQGKTFLLDALCRVAGGFYFAATEATETETLARLGAELADYLGLPSAIGLNDWYQAVDWLLAVGRDRPTPVVIDEFPYLVQATPSLPSIIQRAYAPNRNERTQSRTRLLLCGSAMSFMGRLLTGNAPLRGRAGLEMVVPTLDYRLAARFWEIDDPRLAALTHSVVGGTPAYRTEFLHGDRPESLSDFGPWIVRNVLDRDSPLFREARHLLAEEPNLRDQGLYHSVLSAIAAGSNARSGIASFIGRKATDLAHPLTVLEDAGLVRREEDTFRAARTTYCIAEPLVTFYHAVMRPEWSRLDRAGQAARVWEESGDRFRGRVVGPHFEALCRDWAQFYAAPDTFAASPSHVGRGVVNDAARRTSHEVDVVVTGSATGSRRPLLAIGEAKWGERVGLGHVERLRRIREVLQGRADIDASATRLMLFSAAGFTDELRDLALGDDEVRLVHVADLYREV
ncbi:ATP-binding protein [Microtetraspora sp. NBRC 16547]|uniref:AAA family ATPase n=1 Tax=Microtetraspora sp. NBRC 16547 TaxID=3030993 RepID=UPI0024A1038B|nr:ATP-binding protein [Microtetraspora sp. NBRC 16547]GLW97496.1 ATPase AAA [Microtetraspora sp. NBRC 16547]